MIACKVQGVYSTVHTTAGDMDTEQVERVEIVGDVVTFHLVVPKVPASGSILGATLHFGTNTAYVNCGGTFGKGDRMTVVQPVGIEVFGSAPWPIE